MVDVLANVKESSWSAGNPSELDYLKPNGFKFLVHNLPNVSFFCQSANIPDVSLGSPQVATPLVDYYEPGDKLAYGELLIRFLIQENMANYNELYEWLIGLGFPESHKQYTNFSKSQSYRFPNIRADKQQALGNFSDASLFVLDSNNNPSMKIVFQDAFPTSLSGLEFEISSGNTDYFVGVASFRYRQYKIEAV
jgi:hypothetical protein